MFPKNISRWRVIGAVHISMLQTRKRCRKLDAGCISVAIAGSSFSMNKAKASGGAAVFTNEPDGLQYSCSPKPAEVHTTDTDAKLDTLESIQDLCPEWNTDLSDVQGPVITSYARSAKAFIVEDGRANSERPVRNNDLIAENHRSGDALPTILVEVLDGFGQSPALGGDNTFVRATMYSPDDLFSGEVNMRVNENRKAFPPITGFQHPGRYEIRIDFREPNLESLAFSVDVRECKLGEFAQENGTLCVLCSGSQYNFDPNASTCQPCPDNGNCTTRVIHPIRGYWHRTPCSQHVQQCVSRDACDFVGREDDLRTVTNGMETCALSETADRDYSQTQCKEVSATSKRRRLDHLRQGYIGHLCGSCAAGYGRSWSFACDKCHHGVETVGLMVAPLLVLLFLSGFAIRGNLNTRSAAIGQTNRISRRHRRLVPSKRRALTKVQVSYEMVEMPHSGVTPSETVHPDLLASASRSRASDSDPDAAKRTVVEIFKARILFTCLALKPLCTDRHQLSPSDCGGGRHQCELDDLDALLALHCRCGRIF